MKHELIKLSEEKVKMECFHVIYEYETRDNIKTIDCMVEFWNGEIQGSSKVIPKHIKDEIVLMYKERNKRK